MEHEAPEIGLRFLLNNSNEKNLKLRVEQKLPELGKTIPIPSYIHSQGS